MSSCYNFVVVDNRSTTVMIAKGTFQGDLIQRSTGQYVNLTFFITFFCHWRSQAWCGNWPSTASCPPIISGAADRDPIKMPKSFIFQLFTIQNFNKSSVRKDNIWAFLMEITKLSFVNFLSWWRNGINYIEIIRRSSLCGPTYCKKNQLQKRDDCVLNSIFNQFIICLN